MRILLTAAIMLFSSGIFAQAQSNPALQSLMDKFNKENPLNIELPAPPAEVKEPMPKQPVYSHTLPSGASVYSLPQDNMPCLVPETVSKMPVVRGESAKPGAGAMPNAGYGPMVMTKPATIRKIVTEKH